MRKINPESSLYKTSLLSFSLLAQTIPLAAVANPSLMSSFPTESATQIQMLGTVPNFAAIICTFLSSFIARKIGAKKTVLLGIVFFLIGGVVPAVNNLKSGLRFLNQSKIIVRILLLENQKLIVNSQPLCFSSEYYRDIA